MAVPALKDFDPNFAQLSAGSEFLSAFQGFGKGRVAVGAARHGLRFSLPQVRFGVAGDRGRDLGGSRRLMRGVLDRFCPVHRHSMKPEGFCARPRAKELPLSCAFVPYSPGLLSQAS